MKKSESNNLSKIIENLGSKKHKEIESPIKSFRPWGSYEILKESSNFKVKELVINPKSSISLQKHKRRSEHWVVIEGEAIVTKGQKKLKLKKNESIGYNRSGLAKSDLKIATIPVGYADGLNRTLSNGNWNMIINGHKAPIVGNICMDMVMLDVTNIDCKEGDNAFVFSDLNPISEMAKKIGTIPYEILTSYSPRVKRVFLQN